MPKSSSCLVSSRRVLTAEQAVPEGFHRRPKGVAIATDIDDGTKADIALPSPSKAGAIELPKGEDGKPLANGQVDEDDADDWGKVGWEPRFGWPKDSTQEGESMLDHTTWVESQIPEKLFGGKVIPSQIRERAWVADTGVTQTGTTTQLSLPSPASRHGS